MSERPGWDAAPPDVDLRGVWTAVAAQVWRRKPGPFERLAGAAAALTGAGPGAVTTPSLLLGWIIATVVVLGAGAAATSGTGGRSWHSSRPRSPPRASPTPTGLVSIRPGS